MLTRKNKEWQTSNSMLTPPQQAMAPPSSSPWLLLPGPPSSPVGRNHSAFQPDIILGCNFIFILSVQKPSIIISQRLPLDIFAFNGNYVLNFYSCNIYNNPLNSCYLSSEANDIITFPSKLRLYFVFPPV